jgi:ABC-type siderophore export system fused ATPase/permease subunit
MIERRSLAIRRPLATSRGHHRPIEKREDRAIIVVTHDQRVHEFADRFAEMEDGRIAAIRRNEGSSVARIGRSP